MRRAGRTASSKPFWNLPSSHVAETARRQHSSLNDRGWLGTLRDQLQATLRHHPIERQVVALRAELQRAEAEAEQARAALAKAQIGSPITPEQAKAAGEQGEWGPLVALVLAGSERAKEEAARALRNLAKFDGEERRGLRAGFAKGDG